MGIHRATLDFEVQLIAARFGDYNGLSWCELGNQLLLWDRTTAKAFYQARQVRHTSVDLNGRNGAIALDLQKPLPKKLVGVFDVVTDYGTMEHINDQYTVLRNVDSMCRVGGLMIHVLPLVGNWPKHCRYRYQPDFPARLAALCRYELRAVKVFADGEDAFPRNQLAFACVKTTGGFPQVLDLAQLGIEDSGDRERTGDYNRVPLVRRAARKLRRLLGHPSVSSNGPRP